MVKVCEIFDLWGNLIVEVDVILLDGMLGCVEVLLGVLIGEKEVVELCDGGDCLVGKGVFKVVNNVNMVINYVLYGVDLFN